MRNCENIEHVKVHVTAVHIYHDQETILNCFPESKISYVATIRKLKKVT